MCLASLLCMSLIFLYNIADAIFSFVPLFGDIVGVSPFSVCMKTKFWKPCLKIPLVFCLFCKGYFFPSLRRCLVKKVFNTCLYVVFVRKVKYQVKEFELLDFYPAVCYCCMRRR